jgi:hypothetical protein
MARHCVSSGAVASKGGINRGQEVHRRSVVDDEIVCSVTV